MRGGEPIFINKHSKVGILMIHGFSSTPNEFKEMCPYLAKKGFTVYAPLIAGHGTKPEDLMKTNPGDWTDSARKAYLELKEKSEKIFLIGNSFGSNLAFWLIKEFKNEPVGIVTLDAPIFLRSHLFILFRLYSYGLFKKYYYKSPRVYKTDYIDMMDEVTYSSIPAKSLRQFLKFIKKETIPNLKEIKIPTLITHSKTDPVVHPKSAIYIYGHLGSELKKICWFDSNYHAFAIETKRMDVFQRTFDFIKEVIKE